MIVIIDYGMGNVGSVKNALHALGHEAIISDQPVEIEKSSHLILPGVGAFGDGMQNLRHRGLIELLHEQVFTFKKPILGICLGMQLLAEQGEEGGLNEGLGWIRGRVRRFQVDQKKFRVPHVGWNDVKSQENAILFSNIPQKIFYFVHSYFLETPEPDIVAATCEYGEEFTVAVQKDNIFGVQFHPEKSQKSGLALLENFIQVQS